MSKQTCINENDDLSKKFMKITWVEFLEMIGRVADLKFRDSELESIPLEAKIEYVLDDLFAALPGLRRLNARNMDEEEEVTESDDEY